MAVDIQISFDILQRIIGILTPFLLAYIAYSSKKKEKRDEEYRKIKEEHEALEKKIYDDKQKARDKMVQCLQEDVTLLKEDMKAVKSLQSDVQTLKEDIVKVTENVETLSEEVAGKVNDALNDLLKLNKVNLDYCQSLSRLIMSIGEGLKANNPDVNVAEAIERHREKERELFASIIKSSC